MKAVKFWTKREQKNYAHKMSKAKPVCDTSILWFKWETCKLTYISTGINGTSQNILQTKKERTAHTFRDLKLSKLPALL